MLSRMLSLETIVACDEHDPEMLQKMVACEGRVTRITASGKTYRCSWNSFTRLCKQFKNKFDTPLPGATDKYGGVVRAQFDYDTFVANVGADSDKRKWLDKRLCLPTNTPTTYIKGATVHHFNGTANLPTLH